MAMLSSFVGYKHFQSAAVDPMRDNRERAIYNGLAERLSIRDFVQYLALMLDALQELTELSLEFQGPALTISIAHRAIGRHILVFERLASYR